MKKTENINIGGLAFIIDEDAYSHLGKYLRSLKSYFHGHQGCDEILEDIEIRIAELFKENLKYTEVITLKDLDKVIKTMGTARDFGIDEGHEPMEEPSSMHKERPHQTFVPMRRRLFRDPDNKVVGGVASGVSAYFGIDNPIWMRLLFVFSIFVFTPVVYVLMWILIPAARTAPEKLSMRGEPVNIDTIAKNVEEELMDIKDKLEDIGRDINRKKKTNNFYSGAL